MCGEEWHGEVFPSLADLCTAAATTTCRPKCMEERRHFLGGAAEEDVCVGRNGRAKFSLLSHLFTETATTSGQVYKGKALVVGRGTGGGRVCEEEQKAGRLSVCPSLRGSLAAVFQLSGEATGPQGRLMRAFFSCMYPRRT